MQSHPSPSYADSPKTAPDEQTYHPGSPASVEQDSPGKKQSMLGRLKEKAKDQAKKLKTKMKKNPSPTEHGNEEEGSGSSSSDDDQADSNEAQVDSNEPSYQNQVSEEETKGDHGDIYAKTISGLDGTATRDILKGTPTQAKPDEEAPGIDAKQELSTDYSQEPRSQGKESVGAFRKSIPQTGSTAVAAGGPFVESVNEEEWSSKDTGGTFEEPVNEEERRSKDEAPRLKDTGGTFEEPVNEEERSSKDVAPKSSELYTAKYDEQGGFLPGREPDTGYEAGSEKDVTQELLAPTFYTAKSDLEDREEKDATSGIQNEEKPLTDEEEIADSSPPVTGEPTTEVDTEAKPQTLTDRGYKGFDAAKGGIAAAAATAVGALGYGGASSKGGEQEQELGNRDEVTEGPKDKSYMDLTREKVGGVKDTITGRLQSGKKEGPVESTTENEPSGNPSEASSTIAGRAAGAAKSFKDTITSKLGYGGAASSEQEATSSPGSTEETGEQKSYTQKLYDTAASKLGYGGEKTEEASLASDEAKTDQKSYTQKLYETAAGAKGVVASKLGYGGGGEVRSEGSDSSSIVSEQQQQSKDEVAPATATVRFSPGEEEKALSQLITDAVSNRATTVKDTLLSPFSRGTPSSTISTETARGTEEDDATSNNSATSPTTSEQSIVGRVSGVVSSILGKKTNGEKKDGEQAAIRASQDITPESAAIQ